MQSQSHTTESAGSARSAGSFYLYSRVRESLNSNKQRGVKDPAVPADPAPATHQPLASNWNDIRLTGITYRHAENAVVAHNDPR